MTSADRSSSGELLPAPMNYLFDSYELDTSRFELRLRGSVCRLQPKPLDLLVFLIENRSRVVLKSELLAHLWPGISVTENALAQAVAGVRQVLSEAGSSAVTCVRSRGYRFTRSVVERHATDPAPSPAALAPPPPPAARRLAGALAGSERFLIDADNSCELDALLARAATKGTKVVRAIATSTGPVATFRALMRAIADVSPNARVGSLPLPVWLTSASDEHTFVAGVLSLFREQRLDPSLLVIERLERADIASVLLFGMLAPQRRPNVLLFATCSASELPRERQGLLGPSVLEQVA